LGVDLGGDGLGGSLGGGDLASGGLGGSQLGGNIDLGVGGLDTHHTIPFIVAKMEAENATQNDQPTISLFSAP
jgi:hypothetical protein